MDDSTPPWILLRKGKGESGRGEGDNESHRSSPSAARRGTYSSLRASNCKKVFANSVTSGADTKVLWKEAYSRMNVTSSRDVLLPLNSQVLHFSLHPRLPHLPHGALQRDAVAGKMEIIVRQLVAGTFGDRKRGAVRDEGTD